MAKSILITQCLQRDFIDPLLPHDPLPNCLHVGYSESARLLGHDPAAGPIAQLMHWARAQRGDDLEIIHIRDWHDRNDPKQSDHLRMFGEHCIQDTPGAQLILNLDSGLAGRRNERTVDSIALNDFEQTTLAAQLDAAIGGDRENVRIGVVGVWTEAKVSFLLYDLKTRYNIQELATCSALTASASRAQHFNALEQLSRILGVKVFDTVGDLVGWLSPGSSTQLPGDKATFGHRVLMKGTTATQVGMPALTESDQDIVGYLYRDSSAVNLEPLSGGFSGALVFRATSADALGHQQAPSVVKLGPNKLIGAERVAFERVEEILGNNAPSVRGFAEIGSRAGIKYSFASMGQGKVRSLKGLFDGNQPVEKIDGVLKCVFGEVLRPFYSAARYERMPLLEHYRFSPEFAPHVRKNVEAIVGTAAAGKSRLEFAGGYVADNLCGFYESFLKNAQPDPGESHFVSYVHGDLNGANILVDGRDNVWIIDFFHTAPGHVLKDLVKLENDLLYIFTPIPDRETLAEALLITRALRAVEDLASPLPEAIAGIKSPQLLRAWAMLRTLRGFVSEYCRSDRHPVQMDIALLRYAAHTLSFDESSPLQKEWALAAACGYAEDVVKTRRAEEVLRIDWIGLPGPKGPAGRLGITICPGRRDRGRDLAADLEVLANEKVSRVICMVTDAELEWAGVRELGSAVNARGMQFRHFPVADQNVPALDDTVDLVRWILAALHAKENVVIHCMGGLGRSGTLASCVLTALGSDAASAIAAVRSSRGPRAVEVRRQEEFVEGFAGQKG